MSEFYTALTDFVLTAICSFFVWRLWSQTATKTNIRNSFIGIFAATGVAAFLGGIAHGWMANGAHPLFPFVWIGVLAMIGVASYYIWLVVFQMTMNERLLKWSRNLLRILLIVYFSVILFLVQNFTVAIIVYLPPAAVLFLLLLLRTLRTKERSVAIGMVGLLLTFVAAFVQQGRIGFNNPYLDHNGLYHLIQAAGLWCIYIFSKRFV